MFFQLVCVARATERHLHGHAKESQKPLSLSDIPVIKDNVCDQSCWAMMPYGGVSTSWIRLQKKLNHGKLKHNFPRGFACPFACMQSLYYPAIRATGHPTRWSEHAVCYEVEMNCTWHQQVTLRWHKNCREIIAGAMADGFTMKAFGWLNSSTTHLQAAWIKIL